MPDPQPPTGGMNSHCRSSKRGRAGWHCAVRFAGVAIPLLMLCISLNAIVGCGSGTVAFDGGHIPVGGGSAASLISGTAYAAEDYTAPVAGAMVTVTNTSITGDRRTQVTTTAANGTFAFTNGFPDVSNVNQYQISVTAPVGSNRVSQQILFPVNAGQSAMVLVAMPQISFNESQVAAVTVLQQGYALHTGDTIDIGAELLDLQGAPLPVTPTFVFAGNFGVITGGGQFTSTSAGTGTVSAYWYTGALQLQSNTASITANKNITVTPPAPPPPISGPSTVPSQ